MLSTKEIKEIHQRLDENPSKNTRRKLRKRLTEHEYASKYPPFSPLSYDQRFVNRTTSQNTLVDLIRRAEEASIFLLDTESTTVPYHPNEPALIQLQIVSDKQIPIVLIVEVKHLPPIGSEPFDSIKELFRITLDHRNEVYTWGQLNELDAFERFGLFTRAQIGIREKGNLQEYYKEYWRLTHVHTEAADCRCEGCIGIGSNNPWSLQAAVAEQLHEWLDKRNTCSQFGVGLDPQLHTSSQPQSARSEQLAQYAVYDCLAMERLMIDIQEHPAPEQDVNLSYPSISIGIDIDDADLNESGETIMVSPMQSLAPSSSRTEDLHQAEDHLRVDEQLRDDESKYRHRVDEHRRTENRLRTDDRRRADDPTRDSNAHDQTRGRHRNDNPDKQHDPRDRSPHPYPNDDERNHPRDLHRSEDRHNHSSPSSNPTRLSRTDDRNRADNRTDNRTDDRRRTIDQHDRIDDRQLVNGQPNRTKDYRRTHDQPDRTEDYRRTKGQHDRIDVRRRANDQPDRTDDRHRVIDRPDRIDDRRRANDQHERIDNRHPSNEQPQGYQTTDVRRRASDQHDRTNDRRQVIDRPVRIDGRRRVKGQHNRPWDRHRSDDRHRNNDHDQLNDQPGETHDRQYRNDRNEQPKDRRRADGPDRNKDRPEERQTLAATLPHQEKNEEQRIWRNRKATLKQRRRSFRHEIIRRGIDPRFSIKTVKEILRRFGIIYSAVNIAKSTTSGRTSLYIGVRQKSKLRQYEVRTRTLFTTDFYEEFRARHHQ